MIRLVSAAFIFVLFSATAQAQTAYAIATTGNDSNNCSVGAPCKTLVRVCNLVNSGPPGNYSIAIADGHYAGGCDITYYHLANITGNWTHPENVVIDPTSATAFSGEDHAIITINALSIHSDTTVGIGLQTRQFTIADWNGVRWGAMSIHVSTNEKSKANCLSETIYGSAVYHLAVNGQSQIIYSCAVNYTAGSFSAFAWAVGQSVINAGSVSISGGGSNSGYKYILDGLTLGQGVAALPGSGVIVQNGALVE